MVFARVVGEGDPLVDGGELILGGADLDADAGEALFGGVDVGFDGEIGRASCRERVSSPV